MFPRWKWSRRIIDRTCLEGVGHVLAENEFGVFPSFDGVLSENSDEGVFMSHAASRSSECHQFHFDG